MMKLLKNEDAFTGLEAAIVLIAFIVVAAVFSYVMLGAGFFATQEAQRTVHTGSQQASSSLEIIGNIYGKTTATTEKSTANAHLQYILFSVGNTAGGAPIDITSMVVTFVCGEKADVITFDETNSITGIGGGTSADEATANTAITAGKWGVINTYNDVGAGRNKLLEPGEQFVVKIAFPDDGTVLKPNTRFSVNLQPAIGAAFPIKKTVPSNLYAVTPV
ncbi:archaellin/type IV pilin N-terminal domain-containing protein [Methanoculleus sp. 7T]|uniref:archaellin/type IV pilin N-terminal domain-containing protein n=1 Tax=Methanoculleus sp. 7T TaxID=2937282 RepID=UPI0020C11313|nr:archaellin/type IV pilin N-terminal domain-containing protein [Methanoculleus sp. 7T]MCK8517548.1 flagellin [Methanoculleus sp. 7T]